MNNSFYARAVFVYITRIQYSVLNLPSNITFGDLRFVLQPMYQSEASLDKYAFRYTYDGRHNCIQKKIPGAQYIEYMYDIADRMIFSQDGNQRTLGKWMFYEYDNLSRLTCQGECTGKNATTNRIELLHNYYDNYTAFRSATGNNGNFPDDISGNSKGYQTGSIITVLGGTTKLYTVSYYDLRGRVTKQVASNLLGGYETTTSSYTFTDKPSTVTHVHTASGKTTRTEVYAYIYDERDRVSKVEHTLDRVKVTLVTNMYNSLGCLLSKSLHGSATNKLTFIISVAGCVATAAPVSLKTCIIRFPASIEFILFFLQMCQLLPKPFAGGRFG